MAALKHMGDAERECLLLALSPVFDLTTQTGSRSIKIPDSAIFEIKQSRKKGLGVFATSDITRGTIIHEEDPLVVIHKKRKDVSDQDVDDAYSNLSLEDQQSFNSLCDHDRPANPNFRSRYDAFNANQFTCHNFNGPHLTAMYILASRFNHSCLPNAVFDVQVTTATLTVTALKSIAKGEEIFFAYSRSLLLLPFRQRKDVNTCFACRCTLCQSNEAERRQSDVRRTILCAVYPLLSGRQVKGSQGLLGGGIRQHGALSLALEEVGMTQSDLLMLFGILCELEGLIEVEI